MLHAIVALAVLGSIALFFIVIVLVLALELDTGEHMGQGE